MTSADFKRRLESKLSKCGLEWTESEHYLKGVLDVGPYQDHDILSPICRVADQSERIKAIAFALLELSGKQKVGHVAVINGILVCKADCSVDAPDEIFETLLRTICKMADTLEKILTEGLDGY